jgi:hypothetical protein
MEPGIGMGTSRMAATLAECTMSETQLGDGEQCPKVALEISSSHFKLSTPAASLSVVIVEIAGAASCGIISTSAGGLTASAAAEASSTGVVGSVATREDAEFERLLSDSGVVRSDEDSLGSDYIKIRKKDKAKAVRE